MKALDVLAVILLVLGGLAWGIVGVANFNVITWLFATMPAAQRIIYILVGLAAIWRIVECKAMYNRWCKKTSTPSE